MSRISSDFIKAAAGLLLAACLSSCALKDKETPEAKTLPEITLWYSFDNSREQEVLADLISGFNHYQNEVRLTAQYIPNEDLKKRLALSMADDTLPELALIDSVDFMYLNSMEPFVDLTDELPQLDVYMDVAIIPCTLNGRIYGLPFEMNCPALFYNKALLSEAGYTVPSDWGAFYQTAVDTSQSGKKGFAITATTAEETIYQFLPILWSMGGDISSIDSPESAKAFAMLGGLAQAGAIDSRSVDLTMADLLDQFAYGNLAMVFHSSMAVDTIRSINPELEFDVSCPPSSGTAVTVVGGDILAVSEGPYQRQAIEFLRYISNENRMLFYLDRLGALAPRQDVLELQFADDPVKQRFKTIFRMARPREFTPAWPRLSSAVTDAVGQVIIGKRPQEEILDEAAKKIQTIREEQP